MQDDDNDSGLMGIMKNQKGKKQKKGKRKEIEIEYADDDIYAQTTEQTENATEPSSPVKIAKTEDVPPAEPEIRIKTKKEKERERKERQKLAQKALKELSSSRPESKESVPEPEPEQSVEDQAPKAKGKSKKKGPQVAALKEFLAQKQAEEDRLRLEQERFEQLEKERIAEEERLQALKVEQEQRRKERKKEKEKEKKDKLRAEGKLVSDSQLKKYKKDQERLGQMLQSGAVVAAMNEDSTETPQTKKKVVYTNKKKIVKVSSPVAFVESTPAVQKEDDEIPDSCDASDDGKEAVADSWEMLDSDEEGITSKSMEQLNIEAECYDGSEEEISEVEDEEDDDAPQQGQMMKPSENLQNQDLRSPICVILGHVDVGKTKLLDKIRQTNVQEGEAGGITQQIGATYFPVDALNKKTELIRSSDNYKGVKAKSGFSQDFTINIPGLLVIDTPGHESFTNLRSRGSTLCNIAVLVVDIMHGLEPQTIESINLLKKGRTPFIVALNKIDRIYGWAEKANNPFADSYKVQNKNVKKEFEDRLEKTKLEFAEQGLNAELYLKNPDVRKYVSLVPTSAFTGEGIPDLLALLVQLTQNRLTERLRYLSSLEATVLEVKMVEGLGTTIDVILSNGVLKEGDRIVICGLNGPIVTTIRALLTPQPMKELRIKSAYVHHKEIKAAMGVKISAPDLDKAIAGSRLLVLKPGDDEEELKEEAMTDLIDLFESVDKSGRGVCVQASTLGSLEALLSFLKDSKIPVSGINIGPVHRKDIVRAAIMLEHDKEYAVLLAFDVKIDKDALEYADTQGVKIFTADIIYHLFDQFTAYRNKLVEDKKAALTAEAIWPCTLKIVPGCVFNKSDPIILGVDVLEGVLKLGTPICVPGKENVVLGKVVGIENNHKPVDSAKKGMQVAVRLESEQPRSFGRHFVEQDELCSRLSRRSIDVLKEAFRAEVSKDEWLLVKKLKTQLNIQ